jgi:hypothetical protein
MSDNEESFDCSSLLYGFLSTVLEGEKEEAVALLKDLVSKMESGTSFDINDLVPVICNFMEDLEDLGYVSLEDPGEEMVGFDIKTVKDDDPKKRLN